MQMSMVTVGMPSLSKTPLENAPPHEKQRRNLYTKGKKKSFLFLKLTQPYLIMVIYSFAVCSSLRRGKDSGLVHLQAFAAR